MHVYEALLIGGCCACVCPAPAPHAGITGRAVALSLGSLVVGILLGAGLNAWLRVDIVPIGVSGAQPPGHVVGARMCPTASACQLL